MRLRDLERRVTAGDTSARARLLAALVRVGLLKDEQLRLAAYCGDADAQLGVGTGCDPEDRTVEGVVPGPRRVRQAGVRARRGAGGAARRSWVDAPRLVRTGRCGCGCRGVARLPMRVAPRSRRRRSWAVGTARDGWAAVNVARAAGVPDAGTPVQRRQLDSRRVRRQPPHTTP